MNKQKQAQKDSTIKSVLIKVLPILLIIIAIIVIAVSCTAASNNKKGPTITNGDETYLTVTEGDKSYSFDKQTVYDLLKNSYVISTLFSLVDEDLLQKEKVNNVSYLDMVTEEQIAEAIEKATFENGKEDLTEDEIAELEEEFDKKMFSSGYRSAEAINKYYKLEVARKIYATDMLEEAIEEKDAAAKDDTEKYFPTSKIQSKYDSLYKDSYFAIVVKYNTVKEVENALEQLGIKLVPKDTSVSGSYPKWVWITDDSELTVEETIQAMIDLYNTENSYKVDNYPTESLSLIEGVHYTIDEGKYIFNTTVQEDEEDILNELHYTQAELTAINSGVLTQVKTNLISYDPEESVVNDKQKWFTNTVKALDSGKIQYLAMKFATISAPSLETVKEEIIEALKEEILELEFINEQMYKLRSNYDIVIYDQEVRDYYISQAETFKIDFEGSKKTSKDIIAEIDGVEYSANTIFEIMNDRYGMNFISNQINYERLLLNQELNTVFDYKNDKVLDKKAWDELTLRVQYLKQEFAAGQYAGMGWANYIKYVYQVDNETDLKLYLLYEDLSKDFIDKKYGVEDIEESSSIWDIYVANMEKIVEDYYNVAGYHLLISVNDNTGTPINPDEWTDYQKTLAEELDSQVKVYLQNTPGKYSENFEKIVSEFAKAPKLLVKPEFDPMPVIEDALYVLDNIEISKFKSAGLSVKYEDLGSFENGKMVEAFSVAMREIWNAAYFTDGADETTLIYGVDISLGKNIVSEFGYHVYVNVKSLDIAKWEDESENKYILPTLEQIQKYIEDKADETLTAQMKTAITTYFTPITTELLGESLTSIELLNDQKELNINFEITSFSREDYNKFLDINIDKLTEELVYTAHLAK